MLLIIGAWFSCRAPQRSLISFAAALSLEAKRCAASPTVRAERCQVTRIEANTLSPSKMGAAIELDSGGK